MNSGRESNTNKNAVTEPRWFQWLLIAIAVGYLAFLLLLPLASVFVNAFQKGVQAYFHSFADADTLFSIRLTLLIAAIAVPLNLTFGVAASWAIAKFDFRGKNLLTTLIDLPFAVSPVVAGLIYVLLFGKQGWLGPWLDAHDIKLIFAVPGIVLATIFVTFPMVARELIPLMQEQGNQEEEAAITLGASGWQTFWRVTLPNINDCLQGLGGRLLPFGWAKLAWNLLARPPRSVRMPLMGVLRKHHGTMVGSALAIGAIDTVRRYHLGRGTRHAELSWILEDNMPMRRLIEAIGGRPYKTYRIYERALT